MEFYGEISLTGIDDSSLHQLLSIHNLPRLCRSIDTVITDHKTSGIIYCLWGEFIINREELPNGVRFSLPKCPNALAWTVTNQQGTITVHCTINTKKPDADFISSIKTFVSDWTKGLDTYFHNKKSLP